MRVDRTLNLSLPLHKFVQASDPISGRCTAIKLLSFSGQTTILMTTVQSNAYSCRNVVLGVRAFNTCSAKLATVKFGMFGHASFPCWPRSSVLLCTV